jgi:peptidoglycan hydrolase-like protein with peptidoglycan-binding domain
MTVTNHDRDAATGSPAGGGRRRWPAVLLAATMTLGGLFATAAPAAASHHGSAPAPVTCAEQLRPVLRIGSTHPCVASLQHFLRSIAFVSSDPRLNPGPTDAHFGSGTANAVKRFQQLRGLVVDGVVGAATWRAMAGDCAIFYARGAYNVCHTTVGY